MHSKQDWEFFDPHNEEQNRIADHILGMVARRDGKPFDPSKSPAWQRGWTGIELCAQTDADSCGDCNEV